MANSARFKDHCRVCLEQTTSIFSVNDPETRQRFEDCTSILCQTRSRDHYPTQLCTKCNQKLTDWFSFRLQALDTDRQLQRLLGGNETEDYEQLELDPIESEDLNSMAVEDEDYDADSISEWELENTVSDSNAKDPPRKLKAEGAFSCQFCDLKFKRKISCTLHLRNSHPVEYKLEMQKIKEEKKEKVYECDICGDFFTHSNVWRRHKLRMHNEDRPFPCEYCSYKFNKNVYLVNHLREKHPEKSELHEKKPKETDSTVDEPIFKCSICDNLFVDQNHILEHLKEEHPGEYKRRMDKKKYYEAEKQKVFQCNKCQKTFSVKSSYNRHKMNFHSNERPYACSYCKFRCKTKCGLVDHQKNIHHIIKPKERKSLITVEKEDIA